MLKILILFYLVAFLYSCGHGDVPADLTWKRACNKALGIIYEKQYTCKWPESEINDGDYTVCEPVDDSKKVSESDETLLNENCLTPLKELTCDNFTLKSPKEFPGCNLIFE